MRSNKFKTRSMPANERKLDSWIEISSKRSSSSLSSSADEVITHGLRVGNSEPHQRQGHVRSSRPTHISLHSDRPTSAAGSSQDEYTESESESDRAMSSSNEALSTAQDFDDHSNVPSDVPLEDDDDEDENATALGARNVDHNCFTPQPNAFSHPPASRISRLQPANDSYFTAARPSASRSTTRRASFPAQQNRQANSPHNPALSPHQPDHDAALRASLTTLLSCAAAARALPKPQGQTSAKEPKTRQRQTSTRIEPNTLRIIAGSPKRASSPSDRRQASSSPSRNSTTSEKGKRKAPRSSSKERRAVKRLRSVGTDEVISPTLLTWVVSAGVLVLVSALSFSAGVTVGREAEKLSANGWSGLDGLGESSRRTSRTGFGLRRRLFNGAVRAVAA